MTDLTVLRRCCGANPDDIAARLVMADCLEENGQELYAVMQRHVAEPNSEQWVRAMADYFEREGDAYRVAHIRAQLVWNDMCRAEDFPCPNEKKSARQRAAGKCPACKGSGRDDWGRGSGFGSCHVCFGTGDSGGLLKKFTYATQDYDENGPFEEPVRLTFRYGVPHCVTVPRLADVVDEKRFRTYERDQNGPAEYDTDWHAAPWAAAVMTAHPTVSEFRVLGHVPELWASVKPTYSWFIDGLDRIPEPIFDLLTCWYDVSDGRKMYLAEEQANAALARALARFVRAEVELR